MTTLLRERPIAAGVLGTLILLSVAFLLAPWELLRIVIFLIAFTILFGWIAYELGDRLFGAE
jgi:hypothetical protein